MESGGAIRKRLDFLGDRGEIMPMRALDTTPHCVAYRLGHMGDVALTTGVLDYWHRTRRTTFTLLTRAGNAPLFDNHPAVTEVIPLSDTELKDVAWFTRAGELARDYADHTLIDLHGTLRSRILSLRWKNSVLRYPKFGITRRLYDRTRHDIFRKKLESTTVPQRYAMALGTPPPDCLDVLPRIFLSENEIEKGKELLPTDGNRPLVALHPYATHKAKEWPRAHWHALIKELDSADMDWVVIGRDNAPLLENNARDLTNATNLRETCALLDQADLLITGDSGPMHLACGVRTPVAALFGATAKAWGFYPAGPMDQVLEQELPCRPCSLHGAKACDKDFECMASITPDRVTKTAREILGLD